MRLFCFTFAGGTALFFHALELSLAPAIETAGLEYAGHGTRHREPFYNSFAALADDLYDKLQMSLQPNEPYALFGYSMGSIAMSEVLQRILAREELPPPCRVFLAAHAPAIPAAYRKYGQGVHDENLKAEILRFGDVPEKLVNDPRFWRLYLPVYRADFALLGRYDFDGLHLQTQTPATVLYSPADTPLFGMAGWKRYYTGPNEFISFEGTHFFIRQHNDEIARLIKERLLENDV